MFTTQTVANIGKFFDILWNGNIKNITNFLTHDAKFSLIFLDGEDSFPPTEEIVGREEIVKFFETTWVNSVERSNTKIIDINMYNSGSNTFIVETFLVQPHLVNGEFKKFGIKSRQILEITNDLISSFVIERISKCNISLV